MYCLPGICFVEGQSRRAELEVDLASIWAPSSLQPLGKLGKRKTEVLRRAFSGNLCHIQCSPLEVVERFGAQRSNDLYENRFSFPGKSDSKEPDLVSKLFRELKVAPTESRSVIFKMEVAESRINLP